MIRSRQATNPMACLTRRSAIVGFEETDYDFFLVCYLCELTGWNRDGRDYRFAAQRGCFLYSRGNADDIHIHCYEVARFVAQGDNVPGRSGCWPDDDVIVAAGPELSICQSNILE